MHSILRFGFFKKISSLRALLDDKTRMLPWQASGNIKLNFIAHNDANNTGFVDHLIIGFKLSLTMLAGIGAGLHHLHCEKILVDLNALFFFDLSVCGCLLV